MDCGDLTLSMLDVKIGADVYYDLGPDDELQMALAESLKRNPPAEELGFFGSALLGGGVGVTAASNSQAPSSTSPTPVPTSVKAAVTYVDVIDDD